MGLGIHWTNQLANKLHKPVRRRFDKRTVFAKQVDDKWAALLRARATIECTGNLSCRTSTQEEEKSSICQMERLQ